MSKELVCDICRKIITPYSWWGKIMETKVLAFGKTRMDICNECMQLIAQARKKGG